MSQATVSEHEGAEYGECGGESNLSQAFGVQEGKQKELGEVRNNRTNIQKKPNK